MIKHPIAWTLALAGLLTATVSTVVLNSDRSPVGTGGAVHTGPASKLPRDLADVDSWAFAIGDGALDGSPGEVQVRLGIFDLVVVDGEEATPEQIAALHARGTLVLAYLSVGTIEPWRSWYPTLKPFALERMSEWDEYYADVNAPGYRRSVLRLADTTMEKHFDGLFVDNVDMVESHPSHVRGMRTLVSALSEKLRHRGRLLFAQNGDDFAITIAALLDGWNREDVSLRYDFDTASYARTPTTEHEAALATLESMRRAGVFVTTTDYVSSSDSADECEALRVAFGVGALPYVSDIGLERIPRAPFVRPPSQRP